MKAMNLVDMLQAVQDFRAQLGDWGVTSQGLWLIGTVAILLFVISLREVLSWYLRVQQVRDEVRSLRAQMTALQKTLDETRALMLENFDKIIEEENTATPGAPEAVKPDSSGPNRFRFDH
jgi:hypothetical protein